MPADGGAQRNVFGHVAVAIPWGAMLKSDPENYFLRLDGIRLNGFGGAMGVELHLRFRCWYAEEDAEEHNASTGCLYVDMAGTVRVTDTVPLIGVPAVQLSWRCFAGAAPTR